MKGQKPNPSLTRSQALIRMMKYCAYQDRCHSEVRTKLLELGVYGDDLEEIISELIVDNFLNEERFARSYARGKFRMKGWGRIRIRQELRLRKISPYCIKKAMEELEEFDYEGKIIDILMKKNKLLQDRDLFKRRGKLAEHAIQKGFEADLVWKLVKAYFPDKGVRKK